MSVAAVSSAPVQVAPPPRASEEASETSAQRAQEAAQVSSTKGAPAPGTGVVVDVHA